MKTTSINFDDGWCINRHTGNYDPDGPEWYSLFHDHGYEHSTEIGYDYEDVEEIVIENCDGCNKPVPEYIVGFLKLCLWDKFCLWDK